MRDRLIELIDNATVEKVQYYPSGTPAVMCCEKAVNKSTAIQLADYLLADGWIRLPCKVGQTVYVPWHWEDEQGIAVVKIEEINFYTKHNEYMFFIDMESDDECFNQAFGGWKIGDSIGKTVFLTREEAERALKGSAS